MSALPVPPLQCVYLRNSRIEQRVAYPSIFQVRNGAAKQGSGYVTCNRHTNKQSEPHFMLFFNTALSCSTAHRRLHAHHDPSDV